MDKIRFIITNALCIILEFDVIFFKIFVLQFVTVGFVVDELS